MSRPEVRRAKQVCASCPVRLMCLSDGLEEAWGIWGGYTKPERERALEALGSKSAIIEAFEQGTLDEAASL